MNVVGVLRARNESRWIKRSIESILPICSRVVVLDDHSTDATPEIVEGMGADHDVCLIHSPFPRVDDVSDEVRDKNYLLERALVGFPDRVDWVVMIDGDEVLASGYTDCLRGFMAVTKARALALPIWYLWDREDQRRVDGVYRDMTRVSVFRPGPERFENTTGAANFHCGNCPQGIRGRQRVEAPLLHFGYLDQKDRLRKYGWYRDQDPANEAEDNYRHMVIGDVFPAGSKFRHGGPLELKPL